MLDGSRLGSEGTLGDECRLNRRKHEGGLRANYERAQVFHGFSADRFLRVIISW
jgi:hypothetical protein